MAKSVDIEFMRDLKAAVVRPPRLSANLLLFAIIGFFVWAGIWANNAPLDEVTVGMGKVIPSTEIQVVQNLEGGIVSKILIKIGDVVKKGQPLMIIDDTQFLSKFKEDTVKRLGLMALVARVTAEVDGKKLVFPQEIKDKAPTLIRNETSLMQSRANELLAAIGVLNRQKKQKMQEIIELSSRIVGLKGGYALAQEELNIQTPMVERGVTSMVELLRLKRSIQELKTSISASEQAIPRARVAVEEVEQKIAEKRAAFRSAALQELNEAKLNLEAIDENLKGTTDRLKRTKVTSPVSGTVIQIKINTVGGVVQPGMDLIEIVPDDPSLLIEARIKPSDIAFLSPNQKAKVKITAYDYSIYGSLDAKLETISADTIIDENGDPFFEIRVRTTQNFIDSRDGPLKIIPGMTAEVDVLTGKKTVLDYLLKPLIKARKSALRER